MNRNFGKLTDGKITYAPSVIWRGDDCICNPSAADYAAAGWLPIVSEKPEKVGVEFYPTEHGKIEERGGQLVVVRLYDECPIVAPPTVYIVEEIIYQLIAAGKLQAVKAVVGDYWELLTMRDRVDAANEYWTAAFPQVCAGLIAAGVFDSQSDIDALLAKCREGYVDDESGREVR